MGVCSIENCQAKIVARGLCAKHYMREKRSNTTSVGFKRQCSVEECQGNYMALGFCELHYKRYKRYGRTNVILRPDGTGSFYIDQFGYKSFKPYHGKRILEHRIIVENSIGRSLEKNEHIHHIDGNKLNNSINNLQIVSPTEHAIIHRRKYKSTPTHKECGKCHRFLSRENFYPTNRRDEKRKSYDPHNYICKECSRTYMAEWYKKSKHN